MAIEESVNRLGNLPRSEYSFPLALVNPYLAVPHIACVSDEIDTPLVLPRASVKKALTYICLSARHAKA
jgi:hypothetical protein